MALLNRPPEERHYRTVWAAFMLGKLALKTGAPEAQKWFQQTRELARQGFADSLGLAADSYGWEGRAEWKQDHPAEAAKLFLTQLSLGDESAVVSLKALIPDRQPIGGMLNYNVAESDTERDQWEPKKKLSEEQELAALERAAKEPLLRRLVTAHILATGIDKRTGKIYFGEFCSNRPGYNSLFTELAQCSSVHHYFSSVVRKQNPSKWEQWPLQFCS
jgi:hypothetical protein